MYREYAYHACTKRAATRTCVACMSRQIQALFAAKPDIKIGDLDLLRSKESLDALFQTLVDRGQKDLQAAATFLKTEQLSAATVQNN